MTEFPTTRVSLLMRVRDTADDTAWEEFASLYRPAIHRFARLRGLQEADAQDLSQNVMAAVADRISDWEPDSARARFRTWLCRVAMNQTIRLYRRRRSEQTCGGTTALDALHNRQDDAEALLLSYQREIFRLVARRVRTEFEESTWQAFWLTAVEGASIQETATSLGRSIGAVYTARSRIIRRLQELAGEYTDESPESFVNQEEPE